MATFTPEAYGAVGNGITDDTAAFNAMNAAIISAGGANTVNLTQTYFIPSGWTLPKSDTTVEGNNTAKIKSTLFSANEHAILGTNLTNIEVRNLMVEGDPSRVRPGYGANAGGFCIHFINCSYTTVVNCKTYYATVGIWFLNCAHVAANNNHVFQPRADGIHFGHGTNNFVAENNYIENCGDDCIGVTQYANYGYSMPHTGRIKDNEMHNGLWGFGVAIYSGHDITVEYNEMFGLPAGGIHLAKQSGNEGTAGSYNITVNNNTMQGVCRLQKRPDAYWAGGSYGWAASDPAEGNTVYHSAIAITNANNCTIHTNYVNDLDWSQLDPNAKYGLMMDNAQSNQIYYNTWQHVDGRGVHYEAAGHTTGNSIWGNAFTHMRLSAFFMNGALNPAINSTSNSFDSNTLTNTGILTGVCVEIYNMQSGYLAITNNNMGGKPPLISASTNVFYSGNY